jgi:predicted flap endonuclease-1-like 5' DNA nuclease
VSELFFIKEGTRVGLEARGIETSYAIDYRLLSERERQQLALMNLRGLGLENVRRLDEHGVRSIKELAALDETQLSSILSGPNMRRVRIYLNAARAAAR